MAADQKNPPPAAAAEPMSPAMRRRLQECFNRGVQNTQSGNFDYATELLTQCVAGDPGNVVYAQGFLGNLQRKYNNNKKGSTLASIRTAGSKASMMNASRKKDWSGLVKTGLEVLKVNPWDISTLLQIAHACSELGFIECRLVYLKGAQDADPKSVEVQRECAKALESIGEYNQAIACWTRVDSFSKGGSEEAKREIAKLQVDLTMNAGAVKRDEEDNTEESADGGAAAKSSSPNRVTVGPAKKSPTQDLEAQIAENPGEVLGYAQLAEFHAKTEKWGDAETVLNRGLEATGGDLRLREQLEDIQLRKAKQHLMVAEKRAAESKTPEANEQAQKLRRELNRLELDVFRKRVDRYPTNTHWKYELGIRLKMAGNFNEAIKMLQDARQDPKHRGTVMLELGECFQQIKQYNLAMQHYKKAIEEIPERDEDLRKKALYRAGVLSMGLKEVEAAEKYFSQLAERDYGYRDVSDWLDKIASVRDKGTSAESNTEP
jgi:tetratricopeptide (TPR) repeat protein